jgi:PAS domain S-box-containing protein
MSTEPVKVLAVDDVAENLLALDALLKDQGVELLTARSGMEALELLLVHDVALALLDVQMPGMDGFELAELMRGTERTRRVPIIFLTAVATDERRKFRGYEAGAVDYLLKPVDPQIVRNKVAIFVELYAQRRELAQQRDQHAAALARLTAHGDNSPLGIVELDRDQRIVSWSKGAERLFGWRPAEVAGFRVSEINWVNPDDGHAFGALMAEMLAGERERATQALKFCTAVGIPIDCECYCSALVDGAGRLVSINLQILDITDRTRAEETQRLLIGELNHRVKNTLASVQAIAQQTLRYSSGPSDFAPTFLGRIQALSNAHSLLSSATWQGASLSDLIDGQIAIGAFAPERFATSGPELDLAPEPALHLALVLHELVTNAHKYGALSRPSGTITLTWRLGDDMLEIDWTERGGPPVTAPSRRGFGSALIERSLKADGGSAVPTYAPEGMSWKLTVPHLAGANAVPRRGRPADTRAAEARMAEMRAMKPVDGDAESRLDGICCLVIEDEPLVALELSAIVEDAGGLIAGSAADAATALTLLHAAEADLAFLDGNLQGERVDEIAAALVARGVPFVFVSGYGRDHLPEGHDDAPLITKPFEREQLLRAALSLVATGIEGLSRQA